MRKKIIIIITVVIMAGGGFVALPQASAADEQEVLKEQVAALQKKVEELEGVIKNKTNTNVQAPYTAPVRRAWDPFTEMDRIRNEMNMLFGDSFDRGMGKTSLGANSFFNPQTDIQDVKDHYVVKVDIPGMEKADINIEAKGQQLFISGEKKTSTEESDDTKNYYKQEQSFGYFSRAIPLPEDADTKKVDAKYKNGVLILNVAKIDTPQEEKTNKIKVN